MELLDVQTREEEELVDGEAEQQGATKEEQGMDEAELQPVGDG
jgi:hypothetical protein